MVSPARLFLFIMEELNLIQTHLGIWKLSDWSIKACSKQLTAFYGIYCIRNKHNNNLLIGEGKLGGDGGRILTNFRQSKNTKFKKDVEEFGIEQFCLDWIVIENDEITRRLLEYKYQKQFSNTCYNLIKRDYPKQIELLNHKPIDNYKINPRNRCWESQTRLNTDGYGVVGFNRQNYYHHILSYIRANGDICPITSTINHICKNKKCINPQHLEILTNKENIRVHHGCNQKAIIIKNEWTRGLSVYEIAENLNLSVTTISRYINFVWTSKFVGVRLKKNQKWEAYITVGTYPKRTRINLGTYYNEKDAAENRDYYIAQRNLFEQYKLNVYTIDYKVFSPHKDVKSIINKNL